MVFQNKFVYSCLPSTYLYPHTSTSASLRILPRMFRISFRNIWWFSRAIVITVVTSGLAAKTLQACLDVLKSLSYKIEVELQLLVIPLYPRSQAYRIFIMIRREYKDKHVTKAGQSWGLKYRGCGERLIYVRVAVRDWYDRECFSSWWLRHKACRHVLLCLSDALQLNEYCSRQKSGWHCGWWRFDYWWHRRRGGCVVAVREPVCWLAEKNVHRKENAIERCLHCSCAKTQEKETSNLIRN